MTKVVTKIIFFGAFFEKAMRNEKLEMRNVFLKFSQSSLLHEKIITKNSSLERLIFQDFMKKHGLHSWQKSQKNFFTAETITKSTTLLEIIKLFLD